MFQARHLVLALCGIMAAALYYLDSRHLIAQSRFEEVAEALESNRVETVKVLFCSEAMSHRSGVHIDDLLSLATVHEAPPDSLCSVRAFSDWQNGANLKVQEVMDNLALRLRTTFVFPFSKSQYEPKVAVLLYERSGHTIHVVYFYSGGMGGGIGRVVVSDGILHGEAIVPVVFLATTLYRTVVDQLAR